VALDAETVDLSPGDTVVIPAGLHRKIGSGSGATFVVSGQASGSATPISPQGPGEPASPAWIV
jgi:mannose-6-phosphate isomerase-like protein (cupin superfamily)